jgi:uncharacterized membrane protein YphA (DoxX/SURF4 family)
MAVSTDSAPDNAAVKARGARREAVAQWLSLAARLALATVWAWAGAAKISDPATAAQAVRAYRILPEGLVKPFGYGLPFVELAIAVLLLAGLGVRLAAAVSALLLLVYIAAIGSVWARGIAIDCGCFGGGGAVSASHTAYLQETLRDVGFLLLAGWLLRRPPGRFAVDSWLAEK